MFGFIVNINPFANKKRPKIKMNEDGIMLKIPNNQKDIAMNMSKIPSSLMNINLLNKK